MIDLSDFEKPAWQLSAACRTPDSSMAHVFYPASSDADVQYAKRICGTCPVQAPCLEYALENDEKFGVWGGTSERERRRLVRHRRQRSLL